MATYIAYENFHILPVRILLDSGSQRSYVTKQLKEKLGLDSLRTETLNLNTFGDDRVTKQRCHEVKIKLEARPENFGWVISGPTQNADKDNLSSTNLIILRENSDPKKNSFAFEDKNQDLTNELRRFWDTESLEIQDEKMGNDNFLNELLYHNDEKRYEVNLPWKSESHPASNGYISCANRLRQLRKRLKK